MTSTSMKAWQIEDFGLANLKRGERPIPKLAADEVLVSVSAVSLNYRDRLVVDGHLLPRRPEMPFVPVSDFAGEVVASGSKVTRVAAGDRVMGNFWVDWIDGPAPCDMAARGRSLGGPLQGALAEYVAIPEAAAVRIPDLVSDEEAATFPIAALTAWFALNEAHRTAADQVVVVQGTGGVALAGLQFAKALGAKIVVTSRSAAKLELIGPLEPWATIDTGIDAAWPERVLALTDGHGADHILEVVGGDNVKQSAAALAPEGQISMIGFLAGAVFELSAVPLMLKRATVRGVSVGHRRAFEVMTDFVAANRIRPAVDRVFAFEEAPAAFGRLSEGPVGKVVIKI